MLNYYYYSLLKQWTTFARQWYLFDAKWQDPIISGQVLSKYLLGKVSYIICIFMLNNVFYFSFALFLRINQYFLWVVIVAIMLLLSIVKKFL
jgi:hypothetical protein